MTLFNDAEIFGFVIFIALYLMIGTFVCFGASSLFKDAEHITRHDKVVFLPNISYMKRNRMILSIICGVFWIFAVAYLIGHDTGENLYEKVIIGKNEESRIASWLF